MRSHPNTTFLRTLAMDKANEHEARSREVADTLRRFLVAVHTGGIGALLAVASSLTEQHIHPKWAFWPALVFVGGLVVVGGNLLLAKHREIKRRDAAKEGKEAPDFSGLLWRSQTWDTVSLLLFVLGALVGLLALSCVDLRIG